jgi:hypothetical protein
MCLVLPRATTSLHCLVASLHFLVTLFPCFITLPCHVASSPCFATLSHCPIASLLDYHCTSCTFYPPLPPPFLVLLPCCFVTLLFHYLVLVGISLLPHLL